ncbi:MAG: hypothetical protein PUP46_05705, partial [Endozoicomonas sp. (ex Botrylloides leachii)]|nr:hypothetical protein [Endozoicomonas sp. (ex Botrylloides leachii)]
MHPNKWPLKKLSACISMVLLTLSSQQKAFADNWVVSHPWIVVDEDNHVPDDFGNLPNIFDPQDYTDNGGNLETGDQRPLKVLYRPAIDSVLDKSGSRLILRTNLFTLDGSNAINISDGTLDGIHIDNMTVWSVDGPGPLEDFNKAAIHIGNPGGDEIALVGSIKNSGNVKGGIYITGEARPITGSVYESAGTNATGGKATLDGGFVVKNNGIAESIDDHAINLQSNAYTDFIVSDINSRISATGENSSAIYVAEGGQLGGAPVYTHQIATLEAVVNSNIDPITGYNQVGDRDDLILPDDESNYIKVDLDSDGNVDDSDNDGNKDLYKQVDFALNNTLSPDISRSSTDKVISIKGQLTSAESTAIKIDGFVSGQIHIAEGGQLTGGLDNVNIDDLPEKAV